MGRLHLHREDRATGPTLQRPRAALITPQTLITMKPLPIALTSSISPPKKAGNPTLWYGCNSSTAQVLCNQTHWGRLPIFRTSQSNGSNICK
ncbi:hypothetical protein LguiA_006842 [Lonicera macranthoides]